MFEKYRDLIKHIVTLANFDGQLPNSLVTFLCLPFLIPKCEEIVLFPSLMGL